MMITGPFAWAHLAYGYSLGCEEWQHVRFVGVPDIEPGRPGRPEWWVAPDDRRAVDDYGLEIDFRCQIGRRLLEVADVPMFVNDWDRITNEAAKWYGVEFVEHGVPDPAQPCWVLAAGGSVKRAEGGETVTVDHLPPPADANAALAACVAALDIDTQG